MDLKVLVTGVHKKSVPFRPPPCVLHLPPRLAAALSQLTSLHGRTSFAEVSIQQKADSSKSSNNVLRITGTGNSGKPAAGNRTAALLNADVSIKQKLLELE